MKFLIHFFIGFAILAMGSDFAAIDGRFARKLMLPGCWVTPFIPLIALGVYILVVFFTQKASKRWIKFSGIFIGYLLAMLCISYPNWLFERYSHKVEISYFLSKDSIKIFEKTFNTPTVQYDSSSGGPYIVVPRKNYTPSMISFIKDNSKQIAEQSNEPNQ